MQNITKLKKPLLISLLVFVGLMLVAIVSLIIVSFAIVRPTVDDIAKIHAQKFAKIVRIPTVIRPQDKGFAETVYIWEMETNAGEVAPVRFRHDTGLVKSQDKIEAVLELPPGNDPSIFVKVLPAVISDRQALDSALDVEHANLNANPQIGYSQISLAVKPETNQTTRISWTFGRDFLTSGLEVEYGRLEKFPKPLLAFLYNFQKTTFELIAQ